MRVNCFWGLLVLPVVILGQQLPPKNLADKNERLRTEKQSPCRACNILTKSFKEGMDKTARGKFEGGDTAYEEEKLGSYKYSEVRYVEIHDQLCKDVVRGQNQCYNLLEEYEDWLEEWWKKQQELPALEEFLCIERAKVCCPPNHFGPDCAKCDDCHGNGVCKGNGTRKGSGKCNCDVGYSGDDCFNCEKGYYVAFKDDSKLLCSKCHMACEPEEGCSGPGSDKCVKCKAGWSQDETGCADIDECLRKVPPCKSNQFCVNNEGSFSCLECDRSCDGCTGDGPDLCLKCADGYELQNGLCTDTTSQKRSRYANYMRYVTYVGLCLATCIVFQNSPGIAAVIGLAVAVYITFSELWLRENNANNEAINPNIDINDIFQNQ